MINHGAIRVAGVEDAPAIARIRVDSWRAAYAGIIPAPVLARMDAAEFGDWLVKRLSGNEHGVFVTEDGDHMIRGFAITGPCRDDDAPGRGEIQAIYLAPDAQGRGVGGPLLEAACAWLTDRSLETVVVWVLTANAQARRFYERLGFVRDGSSNMLDFDGTPIEEIRYRRPG